LKIAVSSTGEGMDSDVDPRFGRCPYMIVFNEDSGGFETVRNPGPEATGGAGIMAAQAVIDSGAGAVVTGQVGPNAHQTLSAAGVRVWTGAAGTVSQALEDMRAGKLEEAGEPTVGAHGGMR